MKARITGTGMAVPERIVTNADLEKRVDTSDEWITTRTGIKERRAARPDEATSSFAVPAVRRALEMAGADGSEVDLVICATVTPDMPFPATANLIQHQIGARGAAAFDLMAGCSGFVYGLGVASQLIEGGQARRAVVVGGEILSKILDWNDRSTCVLFGDGAGAAVLEASDGPGGVLSYALHSDGALWDLIMMPGGGSRHPPALGVSEEFPPFVRMRGNEVFKVAVRSLAQVSEEVLEKASSKKDDVTWFVPHQANRRIIDAVGQRLAFPEERTYVNVARYGNTSAASIPIALDELHRSGRIGEGDLVLMAAFGAGLTWGAALVRW